MLYLVDFHPTTSATALFLDTAPLIIGWHLAEAIDPYTTKIIQSLYPSETSLCSEPSPQNLLINTSSYYSEEVY